MRTFGIAALGKRNLRYHWRMNIAVALGVTAGTAALAGALFVGDSVRGSLREAATARLGRVDYALRSQRFFRETLAEDLSSAPTYAERFEPAVGIIELRGGASRTNTGARASGVHILGVDEHFTNVGARTSAEPPMRPAGRDVLLNAALAKELGASVGDDIVLSLGKPTDISPETLLGRRDDTTATISVRVGGMLPEGGLGNFTLEPARQPLNAFVAIELLRRTMRKNDQINTLLVAERPIDVKASDTPAIALRSGLSTSLGAGDFGISIRRDDRCGYVAVESDRFLLEPVVERALRSLNVSAAGAVLTYLANSIRIEGKDDGPAIPYSTVSAIDAVVADHAGFQFLDGGKAPAPKPGEIYLNDWAAEDLSTPILNRIVLTYYVSGSFGMLETREASFRFAGIVKLTGGADDAGFTPKYRGVTDTTSIADWDPPFPVDLKAVRDKDEDYWKVHRAAPKAFISLEDGQRLWATEGDRFGRLTSLRFYAGPNRSLDDVVGDIHRELFFSGKLDPQDMGMRFEPIRETAITASRGATDFGGLFIGFSLFLIASAAMLVGLLFRLGVERRSDEVGLMLSLGFARRTIGRLLTLNGARVAAAGAVVGTVAAIGYARFMLYGLSTWWSVAMNAPFLKFHGTTLSAAIGLLAGLFLAVVVIRMSLRGLMQRSARSLLAGDARGESVSTHGTKWIGQAVAAALGIVAGLALPLAGRGAAAERQAILFFGGGACLLVGCLCALCVWMRAARPATIRAGGIGAMVRLGIRNAPRYRGRSLLTMGLIASATFVIIALQAFRIDPGAESEKRDGGTSGFALLAESGAAITFDMNTPTGRESLSLDDASGALLDKAHVYPFRLRPGDASSCLNPYQPAQPRILGATATMISRGGFAFASSLAATDDERANPWLLLNWTFDDGALPAIGDEATVKWQLHRGLGEDLVINDEGGRPVRLRFVGLLRGSVLQDELIVSERRFVQAFPSISGYSFFLIETPREAMGELAAALEHGLARYDFDVTRANKRLAGYFAVQNTYLSTFQMLGGLGLILGTVGMSAVMLRNVWERRAELALMRALGFSRRALGWVVMSENAFLVLGGLAAGVLPATLAIAPHIAGRSNELPWLSLAAMLGAVALTGLIAGAAALRPVLRMPLIGALRSE